MLEKRGFGNFQTLRPCGCLFMGYLFSITVGFFYLTSEKKKLRLKLIWNDLMDNERVISRYLTPVVSGACARDPK